MYQLTYTSCKPGLSLNGSGGYTVRAASPGIDPLWLNRAPQLARYDIGVPSQGHSSARLAFQRHNGAAIATHTVRTVDHDVRVASFMHAVIDPKGQLGSIDAISAWGSPFWKCSNDESLPDLPKVDTLPAGDAMNWTRLQRWLAQPISGDMACFSLSAWLRYPERPIILLADNDTVAAVIWMLTHSLPSSLLRNFSFATHDSNPATAGMALVGYGSPSGRLPAAALSGRSWFNATTSAHTDNLTESYAEFVVQQAIAGQGTTVDDFVKQCEQLGIETADEMGLLYRVVHESYVCTEADLLNVQRRPNLLRLLLQEAQHVQVAVGLIGRLQTVDPQIDANLAAVFRESPERVNTLVDSLLSRAGEALRASNKQLALSCIELCTANDPKRNIPSLWRKLFGRTDYTVLSIEMRTWVAAQVYKGNGAADNQSLIEQLLTYDLTVIPEVLHLQIDRAIKVEACRLAIEQHGTLSAAAIEALSHQPDVLARLICIAADPIAVAVLVAAHDLAVLLDVIRSDDVLQRRISIETVLTQAAGRIAVPTDQLFTPRLARHWQTLIASSHGPQLISQVMSASLTQHPPVEVSRFLHMARDMKRLPKSSTEQIERRLHLADALSRATCLVVDFETIVAAVKDLTETDQRKVFLSLFPRLVAAVVNATPEVLRKRLDSIMDAATASGAASPARVMREVAAVVCKDRRLLKDARIPMVLVAYAFGATGTQSTEGVLQDELVDLGFELVNLYARAGGPAVNHALREQAFRWPEPARSFYRLASRGQRINGRLRAFLARRHAAVAK